MNPNQERSEALFEAARHLSSDVERTAYLDRACGADLELRRQVEAMLAAEAAADDYFRTADVPGEAVREAALKTPTASAEPLGEGPGTIIGRYKLLQQIGEGGFGVVYMAEQREPVVRKVAFKVIKLGMDSKQVVARFEAERQALALMDHPHIAKVLDAGVTEAPHPASGHPLPSDGRGAGGEGNLSAGRPYFVMELVHGIPITAYCDKNNLSPAERLGLFLPVCQAIQHAHQKGIIHRDIKPSNVLVTLNDGVPHPMVIDFGVAKALNQRLTEKTLFTEFGQMIGTPAYMSPEQAEMSKLDVDTRSDVYSLGVLLYELLTGTTPFPEQRLRGAGWAEMQRIITEEEPPRPSTRLNTLTEAERTGVAQHRQTEARKLTFLVRGDLDWIVMKCLEKDRTRRYETANGLATDIQRYLHDEPVLAVAPSPRYRMTKFARRHRVGLAVTAALFGLLAVGATVSTWQMVRATRAEREQSRLRQQAQTAQATEAQLRQRAEAQELAALHNAYAVDMNLAQQALLSDNLGKARSLLDRYSLGTGLDHLRGFEWRYLAVQVRSDAVAMDTSSSREALRVAISPDGQTLAVGRQSGAIELWNPATLQRTAMLQINGDPGVLAFSPTSNLLAASGTNHAIRLWQLDPPRIVGELPFPEEVTWLDFAPDGRHLAALYRNQDGVIWDLETRQAVRRYRGLGVIGLQEGRLIFSGNGRHLALGSSGHIKVLDWADNRLAADFLVEKKRTVTSLAFSPDGRLLASGTGFSPSAIQLWDAHTGEAKGALTGHRGWICALLFFDNGRRLISASSDQTIRVWNVATKELLTTLRGHLDEVFCLALHPDNATLFSGCEDGTLARWNLNAHAQSNRLAELQDVAYFAAFFEGGKSAAALRADGSIGVYSLPSGRLTDVLGELGTNNHRMAVAPRSGLVACAALNGSLRIWSLQNRKMLTNLVATPNSAKMFTNSVATPYWANLLRFSTSENRLVLAGHQVMAWDVQTWVRQSAFDIPFDPESVAVSPEGQTLVLGDNASGSVAWWDLDAGLKLSETMGHRGGVLDVDFSPDGTYLASVSGDGTVALWDTKSHKRLALWRGFFQGLHAVKFSPDGERLATGLSGGHAACLWDLRSLRELVTFWAPGERFQTVQFSPDGGSLLCRNDFGHTYIWSPPSFAELDAEDARQGIAR